MTADDKAMGLTLDDFTPHLGGAFAVASGAGTQALTLVAASALPHSPRKEGGFRLEFHGDPQPILPQAIYRLERGDFAPELFFVPTGPAPDGAMRYEAVFF